MSVEASQAAAQAALLVALLPIRDRRDRVVGYSVRSCPADERRSVNQDDARRTVELVVSLSRLVGRSVVVPVTPTLVRDGALSRFASADAVWLISTDSLDDPPTRKAVDRLLGAGFHFALDGFPEGEPLLPALVGATIVLDAQRTSPAQLDSRIRLLLEAGLRPLVRGVDDRMLRHRVMAAGAPLYCGRFLTRPASAPTDGAAGASALRAIAVLASFADGRPPGAAFEAFVRDDRHLAASMLRSVRSASLGARSARTTEQMLALLGRDAVIDQLIGVTAFLMGEGANDSELALAALRRARFCEQVGAAMDVAPHPRARTVAGLLSLLEFALGRPPAFLSQQLELPEMLRDAMLEREGGLGQLVDLADAIEYGWWDDLRSRCARLGVSPMIVGEAWLAAWRAARDELGFARTDAP